MGTSVASALTAETVFEIMKCISDVDMRGRVRMGSKSEIFRFFNSATPTIEIFRLATPGDAQSDKKVAAAPCSETAGAKKLEKFTETCFVAHLLCL